MSTARVLRAACLTVALALVAVGCAGRDGDDGGDGVRGGTLRVLSAEPDITGWTRPSYPDPAIARAYARTLYGYNLAGPPEQKTVPVPDIASGYQLSADRRTYTFTPAPRGPLRPPGQPRGHRPRLHHRHPAALRQGDPLGRAVVRRPHRRGQSVRYRQGQPHLGPGRPRRPHPHRSPWTSRPVTSCRSSPWRSSPRCQGSTRPTSGRGTTTSGHVVGSGPYNPDHLQPRTD